LSSEDMGMEGWWRELPEVNGASLL